MRRLIVPTRTVTTILDAAGTALIVAGTAVIWWPAALIVAGLALLLMSWQASP